MPPRETGSLQPLTNMNCPALFLGQSLLRTLAFHSTIIYCILLVLMVLAVFIWAAFFRGTSRRPRARHHWKSDNGAPARNGNATASAPERSEKRRTKRRRQRKPLNPTLAETRGLPPVRDKESTPPPAY
jgi:hypothetical protein